MNPILQSLVTFLGKLEPKDWITLTASLSALSFSIVSYRQKSNEGKLALRKQLTDILEKISELNIESATYKLKKEDYPQNYGGLLNDKRRFLVRQANFLIKSVKNLVSPYEYLLVAGAFADIHDAEQATANFKKAISSSTDAFDKGIAIRGFARYLFNQGESSQVEARIKYKEAINVFNGTSDQHIIYMADTYVRWGNQEREWAKLDAAFELFQKAGEIYNDLSNMERRKDELSQVASLLDSVKAQRTAVG